MLTALLGIIGCEKQVDNPDVETYINQLKTNSYEAFELPAFKRW
jgi:Tfp pilus assembly protein PilP